MKNFIRLVSAALVFHSVLLLAATAGSVALRQSGNPCAIYLCGLKVDRFIDLEGKVTEYARPDLNRGTPVAAATVEAFAAYLGTNPSLEDQVLVIGGAPMFDRYFSDLRRSMKARLVESGRKNVTVRLSREPQGKGIQRIGEEIIALLPMDKDFPPLHKYDYAGAVLTTSVANAFVAISLYFTTAFSPTQKARMVVVNVLLDFAVAANRGGILNWINRSPDTRLGTAEKFGKDFLVGSMFAAVFFLNANLDAIGTWAGSGANFHTAAVGLGGFAFHLLVTGAPNMWALGNLFNGMGRWKDSRSVTPETTFDVDLTLPFINAAAFAITAPIFAYTASQGAPVLLTVPGFLGLPDQHLNYGHAGLLVAGVATSFLNWNWQIYDRAVPVVKAIRRQIGYLKRWLAPT